MAEITIANDLAKRLQSIANQQNRSLDDVLVELLAIYEAQLPESENALTQMVGMFDDDITDLSATVRETMTEFYRQKHDRTD